MTLLDGKKVSEHLREKIRSDAALFTAKFQRKPHLCVILVGEFGPSQVYVRNKVKACEQVGFDSTVLRFSESLSADQLKQELLKLNQNPNIDGVLVQLPLPKHIPEKIVNEYLDPKKDADGLTFMSLGYFFSGHPISIPCTPKGVISLLKYYKIPIAGKEAVIIGRSNIVGKPMGQLLLQENATVTLCHSRTKDLAQVSQRADIVVVAAGQRAFFGKEYFKQGAVVIDVGIHGSGVPNEKIQGDVRPEELKDWVSALTPVPGGIGPMTITGLLENTLNLAQLRAEGSL